MSAEIPVDLAHPRRIHVIGVGGPGMSACAVLLAEDGHGVSGSDWRATDAIPGVRAAGVEVSIGHDAALVAGVEYVLASTAVPTDNPEVVAARAAGIPVLRRLDLLPAIGERHPFVSIAGTHGKTTTAALTTVALRGAGRDPSFLIGAPVGSLGAASGIRSGTSLVLEADESDGTFLVGPRSAALVTNVEADHLEYWGSMEALEAGFLEFLAGTDGPRLVCADDPTARRLGGLVGARSYGTAADADHRIDGAELSSSGVRFRLDSGDGAVMVEVPLPGLHNARNAAGALALCAELGADLPSAAAALADFAGVDRRFEVLGTAAGVTVVDDYAHLPTEVEAVLAACRSGDWRRVVAVFQPHRYSRTERHWHEFGRAFGDADVLVLCDLYPAGEAPRPGVSGELLLEAVAGTGRRAPLVWRPTLEEVVDYLLGELRAGDVLVTIGAGDVTTVGPQVLAGLRERGR